MIKKMNPNRRFPHPPPHPPQNGHFPPDPPPLPFRRKNLRQLKDLFVLSFIKNNPDGLTGYQLQEDYNFSRGTALRVLEDLESKGYISYEEVIENGRGLKKYKISENGIEHLTKLQEKWGSKFARLSDMAPLAKFGHPFHRHGPRRRFEHDLSNFTTKEDAIDYLRGKRSHIKSREYDLNERIRGLQELKKELNQLIEKIESMSEYDQEAVRQAIEEISKKFKH